MDIQKLDNLKERIDNLNDLKIKELFNELYEELIKINNELYIDDLTKLYNRKKLQEEKDYKIIVMCDVDNFKTINDKLGHGTGDIILIDLSKKLKKIIGTNGIICRYGGDEFTILFDKIELNKCIDLLEELKREIDYEICGIPITISYGISEKLENETQNELIIKADKALYESKQKGKNRVTIYKKKK